MASPTTNNKLTPQLDLGINTILGSARHNRFILNILARLSQPWETLGQALIRYSLIHRLISSPSKELSITLISKESRTDILPISLMDDIEAFLTIHIGRYLSDSFEKADTLLHYINTYRQGKSFNDLTLAHILTLDNIN